MPGPSRFASIAYRCGHQPQAACGLLFERWCVRPSGPLRRKQAVTFLGSPPVVTSNDSKRQSQMPINKPRRTAEPGYVFRDDFDTIKKYIATHIVQRIRTVCNVDLYVVVDFR